MLLSLNKIFKQAYKNHYAIGAFNAFNLETVKAIIQAAKELNTSVIVQTSESEAAFAGIENIVALVKSMAREIEASIILNFDHGKKIVSLKRAIKAGYNSVMIDASELSLEENISKTKEAVKLARSKGIWVEAELGTVPTPNENSKFKIQNSKFFDKYLTNPLEAKEFVERTRIDALAVAIGNQHGFYKAESRIDFQRLKDLRQAVNIPLVLHGGSGISDDDIKKAIGLGIAKINVNTELRVAYVDQLRKSLELQEIRKPHEIMGEVVETVKEVVKNKIRLFNFELLK